MKKTFLFLMLLVTGMSFSQVGIGIAQPHQSAMLDVTSTSKGLLPPRLTTAQRNAIVSPAKGLMIFNNDTNCMQWWNGTAWYNPCDGSVTTPPGVGTPICTGATVAGNYRVGTPLTSGNTITISVNVTQLGTYDYNQYGKRVQLLRYRYIYHFRYTIRNPYGYRNSDGCWYKCFYSYVWQQYM